MPIPLPNLDTRRFDDLVAEMRALIPAYAPEWTNHNPADPGIALIELLAWMTETTLYRVNRIPEETYRQFVKLLREGENQAQGSTTNGSNTSLSLDQAIQQAVREFNTPFRAVTEEDFIREAKRAHGEIARVKVEQYPEQGRVTIVIVPKQGEKPTQEMLIQVKEELDRRKIVGTKVNVRAPIYTTVPLKIKIRSKSNTKIDQVKSQTIQTLKNYLHPLTGGPDNTGWPFGRAVSIFELYTVTENIPGIDYVETIRLNPKATKTIQEFSVRDLVKFPPPIEIEADEWKRTN